MRVRSSSSKAGGPPWRPAQTGSQETGSALPRREFFCTGRAAKYSGSPRTAATVAATSGRIVVTRGGLSVRRRSASFSVRSVVPISSTSWREPHLPVLGLAPPTGGGCRRQRGRPVVPSDEGLPMWRARAQYGELPTATPSTSHAVTTSSASCLRPPWPAHLREGPCAPLRVDRRCRGAHARFRARSGRPRAFARKRGRRMTPYASAKASSLQRVQSSLLSSGTSCETRALKRTRCTSLSPTKSTNTRCPTSCPSRMASGRCPNWCQGTATTGRGSSRTNACTTVLRTTPLSRSASPSPRVLMPRSRAPARGRPGAAPVESRPLAVHAGTPSAPAHSTPRRTRRPRSSRAGRSPVAATPTYPGRSPTPHGGRRPLAPAASTPVRVSGQVGASKLSVLKSQEPREGRPADTARSREAPERSTPGASRHPQRVPLPARQPACQTTSRKAAVTGSGQERRSAHSVTGR